MISLDARRDLQVGPHQLGLVVVAIFLLATFSRTLVFLGAPAELNFAHFPAVVVLLAMCRGFGSPSRHVTASFRWLTVILVVGLAGWIAGGGDVIRWLLAWLVIVEPVLFLAVIIWICDLASQRGGAEGTRRLLVTALGLAVVVQIPFMSVQAITLGISDHMKGTLIAMGAGHHVVSGILGIALLYLLAQILQGERRPSRLIFAATLLSLITLADAKQVIGALMIAGLVLVGTSARIRATSYSGRMRWRRIVVASLVGVAVVVALFAVYTPLQSGTDEQRVRLGIESKLASYGQLETFLTESPERLLVGLGPGNSVSRVALLSTDTFLESNSPVGRLGLSESPFTQEILDAGQVNYVATTSSLWSGVSSWFGIVGDFGLIGLAAYIFAWLALLRAIDFRLVVAGPSAAAVVAMVAVLGFAFDWLEEPNFMLTAAMLLGVAYAASARRPSFIPMSANDPHQQ